MFAVIYRNYLKPNTETEFKKFWRIVANYFIEHRGALGSCLHQAEDGMWIAYSRWPDKQTRDNSWPQNESVNSDIPTHIKNSILGLKACLDEERRFPDICMEVVDDGIKGGF